MIRRMILAAVAVLAAAPASAQAQRETTSYGAWGLTCLSKNSSSCLLGTRIAADKQGERMLLSVHGDLRGTPRLTFRMPANVVPQAGVALKVGRFPPRRFRLWGCDANICEARAAMTPSLLAELKASRMMALAWFEPPRRQATVAVPLAGFAQGWTALSRRSASRSTRT